MRNDIHIFHVLNSWDDDSKILVLKHDIIKLDE